MYCFTSDVESEPDQEAEKKGKAEFNQKKKISGNYIFQVWT